jgi:hypothetical protein
VLYAYIAPSRDRYEDEDDGDGDAYVDARGGGTSLPGPTAHTVAPAPARTLAAVTAPPYLPATAATALPAFLAPGNGAEVLRARDSDGDVDLVRGATRHDLEETFKCDRCGFMTNSAELLVVHQDYDCAGSRYR